MLALSMKKATSGGTLAPGAAKRSASSTARAAELPDLSQYGRLAEYNRKRHFGVTPEPPGTARAREAGRPLEFVVQKHRASQLHYDFRLEHRGVMLSWAVPKGPTLDPSVKRLAMETEPHPMDYNQFEGVIPEGEYGGGTVMIWDKGIWAPVAQDRLGDENEVDRQLKKGDLKFVMLGEKLAGSWVLVRTRGTRQWLLIKHKDDYASGEDLTVSQPLSIVSSRSMAEIARAAGASPRQLQQAAGADPVIASSAVPARRSVAGSRRSASAPSRPPRAARRPAAPSASSTVSSSSSRRSGDRGRAQAR
jgi:bifunctional non-homologous end joining protein LigD